MFDIPWNINGFDKILTWSVVYRKYTDKYTIPIVWMIYTLHLNEKNVISFYDIYLQPLHI